MAKLSKEFLLEIGEFARFPGELLMLTMLLQISENMIEDIKALGLAQKPPLVSDFARYLVNCKDETREEMLRWAIVEAKSEYPDLCAYIEGIYEGDQDGNDDADEL
jgi:hypothetical protein